MKRRRMTMVLMATLSVAALAQDSPALRKGLWDLKQIINGRPYNTRKCMEPYGELIRQHTALRESGCTFKAAKKSEVLYEIQSRCDKRDASGRRWQSDSVALMTVDGDSAYQLDVRGSTNGVPTQESISGRWAGQCAE